MKNLEHVTDDELARLAREGRLVGPTSSATVKQMRMLLRALGGKEDDSMEDVGTQATTGQTTSKEIMVFGTGYVQTDKSLEPAIQSYRVEPKK